MNNQEFFDRAVTHLFRQGRQSRATDGSGSCLYRGPDNTRCAIGAFIPDELYSRVIERRSVYQLTNGGSPFFRPEIAGIFAGVDNFLLFRVQRDHDYPNSDEEVTEVWAARLRETAAEFKLDDSIIDRMLAKIATTTENA